jgi:hypothetical protein
VAEGPKVKWTPRARRVAITAFAILALIGLSAGLVGAFCDEPSFDCIRGQGRDVVRIAVIVVPLLAYAVYRMTRGGRA